MTTDVTNMDLGSILKELNLSKYYSGKLQRDDIFALTSNDGNHSQNLQLAHYINAIVHFNENCRYLDQQCIEKSSTVRSKQKSVDNEIKACLELHPVDISTVLFLCSNDIVRQDLVMRHWCCKLAYPLVITPEQLEPPILYLWPTLGLINTHFTTNLRHNFEDNVPHIEFKTVSFLRFNDYEVSKSQIINILINKTEKVHSVFYHRDCAAHVGKMSEVGRGMIEVFPYLDNEREPILFLNLRGQCNRYQNQKLFLSKMSHVVFLVCSKTETHLVQNFITEDIGKYCEKVVIIFLDLNINDESDDSLSQLDSFSEKLCVPNHLVCYKGMSHSDLREELNACIKSVKGRHSSDDIRTKAEKHHFTIDLNTIDNALKRSENVSNLVFQTFKEKPFESVFPIKGHLCSEWCKMDLEKYKLRQRGNTESVVKYRNRLEIKQNELRSQQLQLITVAKSKILHSFVNEMSLDNSIEEVGVFLRNLKLRIEMATRSTLLKAHDKYRNIFEKLRTSTKTDVIYKEFRLLDEKLENQSLSFLDFTREMGHMYEILIDKNINQEYQQKLLDIAVTILRCGYEIEIMDGRSNWVPISWVQNILLEMQKGLENVRIKVITVLGVQSSGKSTLLNIMFGSQFAVGSGRCTRGMCMHLVKVSDEVSQEFGANYFLVIDTEGLYSSITKVDETNERDKTERELATFAIGLSHITIVNLMGEDMSYLHEILPIAVHAFLRMDLVGLRPKCKLLHQTVEKCSNDKLLQSTFDLVRILDEHTATACTLENIPKKRFREIINFDSIEDVYFFSPLFESVDDIQIISSFYSKDAMHLQENLTSDTESVGTLEELTNHVGLLWNAIKKDDFVFEFKDTVETQARVTLDKRICNLQWKSKNEFLRVGMEFRTEIKSCDTLEALKEVQQRYNRSIEITTNEQLKVNADDVHMADFDHDRLHTHAMQQLLESSKSTIEDFTQECRRSCDHQVDRDVTLRMKEIEILSCSDFAFNQIDTFLDEHVSSDSFYTLRDAAPLLFDKWLGELSHKASCTYFNLEEDAVEAIYKIFGTRRAQIDKSIQSKGFNERQMDTFLNKIPEILSSSNNVATQTEQKRVSEVADDTRMYAKYLLFELQRRNIFYEPNIFKDISLQVRGHQHISSGNLRIKPKFEIELVLYVCGEFIQQLRRTSENNVILSNGLMKTAQSYFLSRCRQKSNCRTNTTQAVEDFTNVLVEEIGLSLTTVLPQEFANSMIEGSYFLQSKQMFLIHSYIIMLDNENVFHAYLSSFESGAEYIILNVYEDMIKTTEDVQKVIKRTLESYITRVCANLVKGIENLEPDNDNYTFNTMELCIQVICKALMPISSTNLKQFQSDNTDDLDPQIVLRSLIANLRAHKNIAKIEKTVNELCFDAYYNKLKNETVEKIIQNVTGCRHKCPFCGEPCCIGQDKHVGEHHALMHRLAGLQGKCTLSTTKLSISTCWDELEKLRTERQRTHIVQGWTIPMDVSTEENSFWKYMFVSSIEYIALKWRKEEPGEIPEPWKALSKSAELGKLERKLKDMSLL